MNNKKKINARDNSLHIGWSSSIFSGVKTHLAKKEKGLRNRL